MKQKAIIRLVVLAILLANQSLLTLGLNPLPFSEVQLYEGVSAVSAALMAIWAWWKNAPITVEAQITQTHLEQLKGKDVE